MLVLVSICLSIAFYFCLVWLLSPCTVSSSSSVSHLDFLSFFNSPSLPSPSALSIPFHLSVSLPLSFSLTPSSCIPSAYSKSWTNKQAAGWLASPIYNSSQSNYSEDVCQTHEVHLSASQTETERKKRISCTIMAWTQFTEIIPALSWEIKIMFTAFLLCFDWKHTGMTEQGGYYVITFESASQTPEWERHRDRDSERERDPKL